MEHDTLSPCADRSDGPVAEAHDLTMRFGGLVALDGTSITVHSGEILGMIGPNGSGKTTVINLLSGALTPTGGRILVGGRATAGYPQHEIARLGVARTYQQIRLFGEMTVADNIHLGGLGHGLKLSPADVERLAARVGLAGELGRAAATLAYGAQRRVEIARALAGDPILMLLDEPAAGLNEEESDHLLETISSIRSEEGSAVLVVDHDLRLIMRLCDRIQVLAEGQTICVGTPDVVQRDPAVIAAYLGEGAPSSASRQPATAKASPRTNHQQDDKEALT